jgi:hypothetical protein
MTNAEIFHRLAVEGGFGPRLDREKRIGTPAHVLYTNIDQLAEQLIKDARRSLPRLPHIHFDFVYNAGVNAFACKEGDQYFIGVTSGTFVLLQMVLCRMLSDSGLLTHAGDPTGEAAELPKLTGLTADAQRALDMGLTISRPKTAARWHYSCHLLSQAALFLIGHEIAHVTRGHVDYGLSKGGKFHFTEIGSDDPGEAARIEKQSMEAEADGRSLASRLFSVRNTLAAKAETAPPWLSSPWTLENAIFDCVFSIDVLFRIFGDRRFAGMDLTEEEYPPLPLRRAMLRMDTLRIVKEVWGDDMGGTATSALRNSAIAVEAGFAAVTGGPVSVEGMTDALSPEGRAHIKRLADCWNGGLCDRLAPFAYEELRR